MVLFAAAAIVASLFALRRLLARDLAFAGIAWPASVLLLFLAQSPGSVRWLPYLAAASLLLLVWFAERIALPRLSSPLASVPFITALGVALIHATTPHAAGIGPAPQLPEAALWFAHEKGLGPRVHNAFHLGGFLIWSGYPEFKTLVDGRNDMVFDARFFLDCVTSEDDAAAFRALEARFPSDWVLAANPGVSPAFGFLDRDPAFIPLFWSEPATIYARRGRYPALEANALRFIKPSDPVASLGVATRWAAGKPQQLAAIEDELLRMQAASPEGVQADSLLVLFYSALGPAAVEQRNGVWARLKSHWPEHPAVRQLGERLGLPRD